jgi:cyclophilin family peptidyl-prolyl cis-trans isomerase
MLVDRDPERQERNFVTVDNNQKHSVVNLCKVLMVNLVLLGCILLLGCVVFGAVGGMAVTNSNTNTLQFNNITNNTTFFDNTTVVPGTIVAAAAVTTAQYKYEMINIEWYTSLFDFGVRSSFDFLKQLPKAVDSIFSAKELLTDSGSAVVDSGATCHVVGSRELLDRMENVRVVNQPIMMNQHQSKITHRGNLVIRLRMDNPINGEEFQNVRLFNVAYCEGSANLLSLTAYFDTSRKFLNFKPKCTFNDTNATLTLPKGGTYTGKRTGDLYVMEWPEEGKERSHLVKPSSPTNSSNFFPDDTGPNADLDCN